MTGTLVDVSPRVGAHAQCHCDDCRRALVWLGQSDPGPDGVAYFQTTPDRVTFETGQDRLAVFTWKSDKLLRWYAPCCNTALFNTMRVPRMAFASLFVARAADPAPFGPVSAHAFLPKPDGKRGHSGLGGFIWGMLKRVTLANLTGTWRRTPFFNDGGAPVAPVRALSHTERAKAQV